MKFDVTAIFFNSSINGATATPPWCMSIGQGKDKKINQDIPGVQDFLDGLIYKSVQDSNKVDLRAGSSNNEYLIISKFDKVFVNGSLISDTSMIVLLVREHTQSHEGRLRISIPPYAKFKDDYASFSNSQSYQTISDKLGCGSINGGGCWFVSDVSVKNQEELHFNCIVVDSSNPVIYPTSQQRSAEWIEKAINGEISKELVASLNNSNKTDYLKAIRTKPFLLLAGISGTGKSRIVRKLAQATITKELQGEADKTTYTQEEFENKRWSLHRPANFELIQVKPNWHNSMDVVGYLSNIPSPHYVFTPFINFIVKAWQNPDVPFFLCLDEMNLAPVEEYFAEFLSAIESRDIENGQYVTDPLIMPFKDFGKIEGEKGEIVDITNQMINSLFPNHKASDSTESFTKLKNQLIEKGLTLPPNLIIVGTVNMDETTFSFSRKVLDRAMSIEMNEVSYQDFLSQNTDKGLYELKYAFPDLNNKLVDRPINAQDLYSIYNNDAKRVIKFLTRINALLDGTPFKLGYRVANEALLYLNASADFGNPDWRDAMDKFTLMKILSRIEGDTNKLKLSTTEDIKKLESENLHVNIKKAESYGQLTILTALKVIIEEELDSTIAEVTYNTETPADETSTPELPNEEKAKPQSKELESVKKLDSMISQLERERFVSYWN